MLRKRSHARDLVPVPLTEPLPLNGLPKPRRSDEKPGAPVVELPVPNGKPDSAPAGERVAVSGSAGAKGQGIPHRPVDLDVRGLEEMIARCGSDFPERIDEWASYLYYLREHASDEGVLPPHFHGLVAEVFGPALDGPGAAASQARRQSD